MSQISTATVGQQKGTQNLGSLVTAKDVAQALKDFESTQGRSFKSHGERRLLFPETRRFLWQDPNGQLFVGVDGDEDFEARDFQEALEMIYDRPCAECGDHLCHHKGTCSRLE